MRIAILVGTVLTLLGCHDQAIFPAAARTRAAAEFHCPAERVQLSPRAELGYQVMDVDACGRQARYACIHQPGSNIVTCVHEADSK